jgi:hypothetical protein
MSSSTAERQKISQLEKQFPGESVLTVRPGKGGYSSEVASVRERVRGGRRDFHETDFEWMLPANRAKYAKEVAEAAEAKYDWRNNAEDRKKYSSLLSASVHGQGNEASREMASYRQFEINSDILAIPFALSAFQSVNLSADELPQMVTPKARQYFTVRYLGQDGGARQDQWRTTKSASEIEMKLISTDKVEYPLVDLQQGDVNESDKINAQLRFDMEMKLDALAKASLDANVMTSGIKDILNIHPMINLTNLPDDNYLDLTNTGTYGTANVLTIARLRAILGRISQWQFGLDPDGPVSIRSMIMSPLHARDSWDYVSLVSGWNNPSGETNPKETVSQNLRDQIFSSGSLLNSAWGMNWETQFNAQLAAGRLYVMTNQPVGWFFTKTDFDRVIEWKDTPDAIEQNIGQIMMRKAVQFYQPQLWAYRYLVVDF